MKKLKFGVVGLGHRGRSMFTGVARGITGIEAAAACDSKPELWHEQTGGFGGQHPPLAESFPDVKFYDDYERMLEEANLDIVMIETPAYVHARFCMQALEKKVHVYSDIPTVSSLEEAGSLWKAVKDSSTLLMTGATTLGQGYVLAMQDLHRQGILGKPYYLEAEYIHDVRELWPETPWRKSSEPIRYCTHSLGPLLSIMDEDLRQVSCVSTGSHVTSEEDSNDLMTAHFLTESRVVVRLTRSSVNNVTAGHHGYRVFGTEGFFEHLASRGEQPMRTAFSTNRIYGARTLTEIPVGITPHEIAAKRKANPHAAFGHGGADAYLFNLFVESIRRGDDEAPISFREGLRMTLPGIFAAESARGGGRMVDIRYPWDPDWHSGIKGSE